MTPQQQVQEKCKQVIETAKRLYNVDLSVVQIGFNLKGRVAGWAQWKRKLGYGATSVEYTCRFNYDMISRGDASVLKDMIEDTVPHELAHIVCYMRPELGKSHDNGWQRVCIALGGTGKRTHDMEVVYGKGTTYEYTTDCGHKVRMSERHHKKVQAGIPLRYRKGKGTVTAACAYSIVGIQGRTLVEPIVKQAVDHPDQVEMARRMAMVEKLRVRQVTYQPTQGPTVPTPAAVVAPRILPPAPGESKAAVSRRIMLAGYNAGHSYETIISAMIAANGYDRQLARGTFKANGPKVGIPKSFYA